MSNDNIDPETRELVLGLAVLAALVVLSLAAWGVLLWTIAWFVEVVR